MDLEKQQEIQMKRSTTNPEYQINRQKIKNNYSATSASEERVRQESKSRKFQHDEVEEDGQMSPKKPLIFRDINHKEMESVKRAHSIQKVQQFIKNKNKHPADNKNCKEQITKITKETILPEKQITSRRKKVSQRCKTFGTDTNGQYEEQLEKKQEIEEQQENHNNNFNRPLKFQSRKKEVFKEEQKYPCSFCDRPQKLQQMDIHHLQCQMAFKCKNCFDFFPIAFVHEHNKVCKRKVNSQKQQKLFKGSKNFKKNTTICQKNDFATEEQLNFLSKHKDIPPQLLIEHLRAQKRNQRSTKYKPNYFYQQEQDNYQQRRRQRRQNQYLRNFRNVEPSYTRSNHTSIFIQFFGENYPRNNRQQHIRKQEQKTGLKNYEIANLVTDYYKKGQKIEEDNCIICTKQKQEGDLIIRLPCFHTFHKQCIIPWLKIKSLCPTCKFDVKSK